MTYETRRICDTCKYDPPSKKWPCVDCDMREPADRWEKQDVPDINIGKINNKKLSETQKELDTISLQPTCNNLATDTISRRAVAYLDLFTKTYCRDYSVTDDLVFRCKECEFEAYGGKCLVKCMARMLCPDYKEFGCMWDL